MCLRNVGIVDDAIISILFFEESMSVIREDTLLGFKSLNFGQDNVDYLYSQVYFIPYLWNLFDESIIEHIQSG